jgi:hypothetical protein
VGTTSAARAWVASKGFSFLTPRRMRAITIGFAVVAVLVSATLSGSGA